MTKKQTNYVIFAVTTVMLLLCTLIAVPFSTTGVDKSELLFKSITSSILVMGIIIFVNFYQKRLIDSKEENKLIMLFTLLASMPACLSIYSVAEMFQAPKLYNSGIMIAVITLFFTGAGILAAAIILIKKNLFLLSSKGFKVILIMFYVTSVLAYAASLLIEIRSYEYLDKYADTSLPMVFAILVSLALSGYVIYKLLPLTFEFKERPVRQTVSSETAPASAVEVPITETPVTETPEQEVVEVPDIDYPKYRFPVTQYCNIYPDINGIIEHVETFVDRSKFKVVLSSTDTYKFLIDDKEFFKIKTLIKDYRINIFADIEKIDEMKDKFGGQVVFNTEKVTPYGAHLYSFKGSYQNDFFFGYNELFELIEISYNTYLAFEQTNERLKEERRIAQEQDAARLAAEAEANQNNN